MNKIGVNSPCSCGSTKKYKKCCLHLHEKGIRKISDEEAAEIRPLMEAEQLRRHPEPYMHFVPNIMFQGKRFRCIWNVVHWREPTETFHEFILWVLQMTFGEEWWNQQKSLSDIKQHVVFKWFIAVRKWMIENRKEENRVDEHEWAADMTGYTQSLMQLAYDVFCLQQVNKLPEKLVNRLRNRNEFQGARYEVGVAAMFARAGFEIEFLEEQYGQKTCEFIAIHKSGLQIAVEAKSRRRQGVLNEKGSPSTEIRADIKKLYAQARKKKPDMQFVIFIDANLPPTPDITPSELPWLDDIKRMLNAFPTPTKENPDPHNFVVITNYGFYYTGDNKSQAQQKLTLWSMIPKHPQTHPEAWDALWKTIDRYTQIPRDI